MNIKSLTESLGVHPNKKLGQNFLVHENTAKKILDWAALPKDALVLEIGPGLGALTTQLVERGHQVFLIERDKKLAEFLRTQELQNTNLEHADVLEFDFETIFPKKIFYIISNAPYSISTPILEKALEIKSRVPHMVFLFQEEVINRICAEPGNKNYGRLAIWVQCQCDIERGPRISKENFFPKPDVESRLVKLTPSKNPLVPEPQQTQFLEWIAGVFKQRRKTLRKNLREMNFSIENIQSMFKKMELTEHARAEELRISKLFEIFSCLVS